MPRVTAAPLRSISISSYLEGDRRWRHCTGRTCLRILRSFPPDLRRRAIAAIRSVERRPEPDVITRRELPIPFRPGTLGASIDGFVIRYLRTANGVEFLRIQLVVEHL
jgi:hypothetical protein